jgi:hypothetical protein
MERGKLILQKLNNHEYIIEDNEEHKEHSGTTNSLFISVEDRIDMFKYFMNKYEFFDKSWMFNYMYMIEFLTVLHPKEFSFEALYQAIGEGLNPDEDKADILKELLLHIKKFFKRRNLKPKVGFLKSILRDMDDEASYFTVLEIIFTVAFMWKDNYSILDYPREFFNSSLTGISDSYNPISLRNTMAIVNLILETFQYEIEETDDTNGRMREAEFSKDPLKKDLCIMSPRQPEDPGEVGTVLSKSCNSIWDGPPSLNPIAKFNATFMLHIKNETLESEGNIYDDDSAEMDELDWLRLNNADENEYLDMLDRKEEEYKERLKKLRQQEFDERKRNEEIELEKQEAKDLQELVEQQQEKIKCLLNNIYKVVGF